MDLLDLFSHPRFRGRISPTTQLLLESHEQLADYRRSTRSSALSSTAEGAIMPPSADMAAADSLGSDVLQTLVRQPPILSVPADIFRCLADYFERADALRLKLVCRGLSRSKVLDEVMYKHPIQFDDVRDIRMNDWLYKASGRERWEAFCESVTDDNRKYVQKLAISHWATLEDFRWISDNLPNLISLDLSNIKDFVWTPAETWTWKELLDACPDLFPRVQDISLCNWSDFNLHASAEFNYAYNDYTYKSKFRLSRRRDSGSVVDTILPACTQLKSLAIRGSSRHITWNEWEVHQRVCGLVDSLATHGPATLTTLRLHDMAPFLSLLVSENAKMGKLRAIEVSFSSWMQEYRDSFRSYSFLTHRMIPGTQHRDEEEDFDTGTFTDCERDHMDLGREITQGVGHSLCSMFKGLHSSGTQQTTIKLRPFESLHNLILHPFHFLSIHRASRHHVENPDLSADEATQAAVKWMATVCGWRPIFAWDTLMCDVFPENIDHASIKPKADIISQVKRTFETLSALGIPIQIGLGRQSTNSGLDRSVYFGDFKHFVGEGADRKQVLEASQARFNLSNIAHLIEELTISYSLDMPGVAGWGKSNRPLSKGELAIVAREMKGWRRFWARYALRFTKLKKLTIVLPRELYADWGRSKQLAQLLHDESWQSLGLDVLSRPQQCGSTFANFPLNGFMVGQHLHKRHPRLRFLKRVFYRQDEKPLDLKAKPMTEEMLNEENSFTEDSDELADLPKEQTHRFWCAGRSSEKRVLDDSDVLQSKKRRVE